MPLNSPSRSAEDRRVRIARFYGRLFQKQNKTPTMHARMQRILVYSNIPEGDLLDMAQAGKA